ncbi:MAG: ATP-binding cassette domain-containing protein [Gemmatirosa sp.]|nr:ATP-binding cassette domain-containing protein [Gemmatirosa sp.]
MSLLVADAVGKWLGGRRVLAAATLRAERGQVRVLFGRNGAGKSTLLKIAAGWIAADTGVVHFDGRAYLRPTLAALARRGLFYLPDHDLLTSVLTVRAQLDLLRRRFGGGNVDGALEAVGIAHVAQARPHTLSGGELRRAELAAVLVRRPACLLADEPFRGIAPHDAEVLALGLRRLAADGCAVVVTGHEVPTLLDAADQVTWCTGGMTYELGPPNAARMHDGFRRDYLGPGTPWRRSTSESTPGH